MTLALLLACSSPPTEPLDYRDLHQWVAHAELNEDPSDARPEAPSLDESGQDLLQLEGASADIFWVHPTSYLSPGRPVNADSDNDSLNQATGEDMRWQASAFSAAGRVFAPRYRQASGASYLLAGAEAQAVRDAAYMDVEAAFQEYLFRWNQGRPFILAGHGQGASHLVKLIQQHLDSDQPERDRFITAYIIGEAVGPDTFETYRACISPRQTECIVSWSTLETLAEPRYMCGAEGLSPCAPGTHNTSELPLMCTNPLNWASQGGGQASENLGAGPGLGVGSEDFSGFLPGLVDAQCDEEGLLRIDPNVQVEGVSASDFAWVDDGDYHAQDVNLFWMNVRANAVDRVEAWNQSN